MPKAKRSRVRDSTPFHNASGEGMEISDDHDIVFQPSELGNTSRKTSKSSSKRKLIMMPEDSSPVDGMNQEESEKALLDALLPTLPKKGLSAPAPKQSRGALVRQHKIEARELREKIRVLKDSRTRLNGDARNKREQKAITQEIRNLEEELEKKHAAELEEFDKANASISKKTASSTATKLNFNSLNLNFSHIKFNS